MDIKLRKSYYSGHINAVSSKSSLHRLLICSAFSDRTTTIHNVNGVSLDIIATIECLKALGSEITQYDNKIEVVPINKNLNEVILDVNESGTTLRLLLPLANLVSNRVIIKAAPSLEKRPIVDLLEVMKNFGLEIKSYDYPLIIEGRIKDDIDEVTLPGDITSQYFSGLILLSAVSGYDFKIKSLNEIESMSYIDMTLDVLKGFNVNFSDNINSNSIETKTNESTEFKLIKDALSMGNDYSLKSLGSYKCPGDYSNMAAFMVLGILNGDISIHNLDLDTCQGDKRILGILKKANADIEISDDLIRVRKSNIEPMEVEFQDIPDLFPILAVLALRSNGVSHFTKASRLKLKESNRINSTYELIKGLGGKCEMYDDGLTIYGGNKLNGGIVSSFNDHRIVMAASVISSVIDEDVLIKDAKAIDKSYKDFFTELENLGGNFDVIDL